MQSEAECPFELAKAAVRRGDRAQAFALLASALQTAAGLPLLLREWAKLATILQAEQAAADLLEAAIAAHAAPAPAAWHRVLGEARVRQGRLADAIRAFRATLAEQPDDAESWRWLGHTLKKISDLPGAIAACRQAVTLSPESAAAHGDLALVLTEARAHDEAARQFEIAIARAGDVPALIVGRARLDIECGRRREAIDALRLCLSRHPNHVPALAALSLALRDERRFDEAAAALRRALELEPDEATLACGLGRTLLEADAPEEARLVASRYLSRRPGHAGALALLALASAALGDEAEVEQLVDYERFVSRRLLPVPPGFADLASFNTALTQAVATHPTLSRAPLRHATAVGLHSALLSIDPPEAVQRFKQALAVAVADYCRALPDLPNHPFAARRPASASLDVWCVVMHEGGHQVPHIHPEAWLSGAYYPMLPESMRGADEPAGFLAFGEPDRPFPSALPARIVRVRPEEGLLVLFPSYFFHHTHPFQGAGTRVSVAFDVIVGDPHETANSAAPSTDSSLINIFP